uniref:Uncharacterized protein n=1 Tax=Glossina pallidipes TaxID=7398 RepID=A0A1B0AAJ0_GLOPL
MFLNVFDYDKVHEKKIYSLMSCFQSFNWKILDYITRTNGYIVPQNIVVEFFMVFQSFDTHNYSTLIVISRAQAYLQLRRMATSYTMGGCHYDILTDDATTAEVTSTVDILK